MRTALLFCLITLFSLGVIEPSASALGLSVPAASVGTLAANTTATSATSLLVVSGLLTESWVLRADVTTSGSTDGHMTRESSAAPCNQGVATLASPLHLSFSRTLPTTTIVRAEYDLASAANPVVAQGTVPDTVMAVYSQPVGTEAIRAGCSYSVSVRYTVAAN